jgi:hypothetical protein
MSKQKQAPQTKPASKPTAKVASRPAQKQHDATAASRAASSPQAQNVTIDRLEPLTGIYVRDKLSQLSGNSRLDAAAIKNLPAAGGGANALNDLTDVSVANPANGQVLKYNGSNWAPAPDNAGSGGGGAAPAFGRQVLVATDGLTVNVQYIGSDAFLIGGDAASGYTVIVPAGTMVISQDVKGNSTNTNSNGELQYAVDNDANGYPLEFMFSVDDEGQEQDADEIIRGHIQSEEISGNVTTQTIPNMNGYPSGFTVKLR